MASKSKAVKKAVAKSEEQVRGFWEFIRSQGVIGLAIGLVLGGAVTTLVKSLIDNIIMPPIGFLMGSANGIKGLQLDIGTNAQGQMAVLNYGTFLNDAINFIVISLVIFAIIKLLNIQTTDVTKK